MTTVVRLVCHCTRQLTRISRWMAFLCAMSERVRSVDNQHIDTTLLHVNKKKWSLAGPCRARVFRPPGDEGCLARSVAMFACMTTAVTPVNCQRDSRISVEGRISITRGGVANPGIQRPLLVMFMRWCRVGCLLQYYQTFTSGNTKSQQVQPDFSGVFETSILTSNYAASSNNVWDKGIPCSK